MISTIGQRWKFNSQPDDRHIEYVVEIIGIDKGNYIVQLLQVMNNIGFSESQTTHISRIGNIFIAETLASSGKWSYLDGQNKST